MFLFYDPRVTGEPTDPTVLWRVSRGRSTAHATIFPGPTQTTVTWYVDGVMDRAENYDSLELAIARAEQIRGVFLRDGWNER
jgi:hypothetical protein